MKRIKKANWNSEARNSFGLLISLFSVSQSDFIFKLTYSCICWFPSSSPCLIRRKWIFFERRESDIDVNTSSIYGAIAMWRSIVLASNSQFWQATFTWHSWSTLRYCNIYFLIFVVISYGLVRYWMVVRLAAVLFAFMTLVWMMQYFFLRNIIYVF